MRSKFRARFDLTALLAAVFSALLGLDHAVADVIDDDAEVEVQTIESAVQVVLLRVGASELVQSVSGGSGSEDGCNWTSTRAESTNQGDVIQVPDGAGSQAQQVLISLFCNGVLHSTVWVSPEDIVDVDAAIQAEAERYVQDVLAPAVRIGVNPNGRGLVGLASWFWIEGFDGSVEAPPISAFGMTVDVRMSSGSVMWDFDDGTVEAGDLGRAYPEESSVQHIHQRHGTYEVTAQIELVPEYSVNGGPWLTLPNLSVTAATSHPVEQRQPVLVNR